MSETLRRGLPVVLACAMVAMAITAYFVLGGPAGQTGVAVQTASFTPAAATIAIPPTWLPSPTPIYPGEYSGTPTPDPTRTADPGSAGAETYIVQSGDTLSLIAAVFGCTVEEIVAANNLPDADSLSVGQALTLPVFAAKAGPYLKLLPDSEMVYGPAYVGFDVEAFVADQRGYLREYTELVEDRLLDGGEIVQLVAQRFSVGPRVLLALLEMQSGWVTQLYPAAETLEMPLRCVQGCQPGLFEQLSWAAVQLNEGYYGWKYGGRTTVRLGDGTRAAFAPELNPGSAGVQNCLAALSAGWDDWLVKVGPGGFPLAYERLFGYPFAYTVDPLVPQDLAQPELRLPWEAGLMWYLTGGPHGGWGNGSGNAALDFVPGDKIPNCTISAEWVVAAAPGKVVRSENGEVLLDLDGDGFEQTGWVLLYMHIYPEGRVRAGTYLQRGQRIGRPSCEGGFADASHLHFARRYNGEWIPAGKEPLPMVLSGWTAREGIAPYEGTMTKGDEVRTACECWDELVNGLVSDNGL